MILNQKKKRQENERPIGTSLAHLASIKPPAPLGPFLAEHQIDPAQPTGLLNGRHCAEKCIDVAVDHTLRGRVAHGGQGDIEHVERHGGYDAKETVEEDRM